MNHIFRHGKRVATAVVGLGVVLIGVVLIPYPGPGWLIVFAGFAILATEFEFAAKILAQLKSRYEAWTAWLKKQPKFVQIIVLGLTGLVVLVTAWLINTFGLINVLFHLNLDWLHSPFLK